jgi:hypothetical protein
VTSFLYLFVSEKMKKLFFPSVHITGPNEILFVCMYTCPFRDDRQSKSDNMAYHSSCVFTGALAFAVSLHAAPAAAFHPGSLSQTAAMRRAPPAAPRQQPTEGLRASRMTLINSEVRLRPRVLAQDRSERSWDAGQSLR